jgi:type III pantothenate kinase
MLLLFDVGNTHTHLGLANADRIVKQINIPTKLWFGRGAATFVKQFVGRNNINGAMMCSVVPRATPFVRKWVRAAWKLKLVELNSENAHGVGIDYPKPQTIGADRLANSVAAFKRFGAPVVVVDFGTAVTFDVVDPDGNYAGGIIAPGLAAMTDYLHEKTALLPRIKITEPKNVIGKSTEQAMLAGAVFGYRGLVRELIHELKREMKAAHLPVVATGGYADLMAAGLPEISNVEPNLTLEGLRLVWQAGIDSAIAPQRA